MRRKYFGLAMAAIATLGPAQAFGGDREIAQLIMKRLKVSRDAGDLKHFTLDMKVDEGIVLFRGKVSGDTQRNVVLASSKDLEGVLSVVDQLEIDSIAEVASDPPASVESARPAKLFRPAGMKLAIAPESQKQDATTEKNSADVDEGAMPSEPGFNFADALAGQDDRKAGPNATKPVNVASPANIGQSSSKAKSVVKAAPMPSPVQPVVTVKDTSKLSFAAAPKPQPVAKPASGFAQEVVPGIVLPTAAFNGDENNRPLPVPEPPVAQVDDQQLTESVVRAIGRAKSEGHIRNFGVDVNSYNGVIELKGNVTSQQQREFIEMVAKHAPGAVGVQNRIEIRSPSPSQAQNRSVAAQPVAHRQSQPRMSPAIRPAQAQQQPQLRPLPQANPSNMATMRQMPSQGMPPGMSMQGQRGVAARPAAYGGPSMSGQQMINGEMVVPGSMMTHGAGNGGYGGSVAGGAPVMGQPVPMAPAAAVGAPRYDSPNLPNYAWPGYAAHPNYAALSYPQQYSPSAFPFIGPFYPYPQVPLGWRKVSLEWDDGWWFLDFTDK